MADEIVKSEAAPQVVKAQAERRRLKASDLQRLRLPKRYWQSTFDEVQPGPHRDVVKKYLEALPMMLDQGYGLLLWGENGVGKTSIAAVIAKETMRLGKSAFFVRAADFRDAVFSGAVYDDYVTVKQRAGEVDLLVIDDIGKEGSDVKGTAERLYEDVVRTRSAERRALILTTNLTQDDFVEPAKGGYRESMVAVLTASVLPVKVSGSDLREREAERLARLLGGGDS